MKKLNCSDLSKIEGFIKGLKMQQMLFEDYEALKLANFQLLELYREYTARPNHSAKYAARIEGIFHDVADLLIYYERREGIECD